MTMLDRMRRHKGWLKWSLALVCLTFVIFYIPDFLRGRENAAPGDRVATIGDRSISLADFRERYQRQIDAYRSAYGGKISEDQIRQLQVGQQVLQQMIEEHAELAEAARLGLTVTDEEVRARIMTVPALQENGRFIGEQRYRQLLAMQRPAVTPAEFEQTVRTSILVEKLRTGLTEWMSISDAELQREYARRNDKVTLALVTVPAADFKKDVTLSDKDVATYFEASKERYRMAERRNIRFVLFDAGQIRSKLEVPRAEVERYYNEHASEFTTPEQVRASHILLKTEGKQEADVRAKAEEVLKQARAGADFADLARKYSEDDANAKNGGDLDYFSRGRMVPEFENAAFALKPGQVSDLVRTPFGFHIIKLTDRRPEVKRTLGDQDLYREIQDIVGQDLAERQVTELADALAREATTPPNLDKAAAARGLKVEESGFFARGEPIGRLGVQADLAGRAFELGDNVTSGPVTVPAGVVIFYVSGRQASHLPTLDEVRARARDDLVQVKALELARKKAEEVAAALKNVPDFDKAVKTAGLEETTTEPLSREAVIPGIGVSAEIDKAAFALPVGGISGAISVPQGAAIVKVVERQPATAAAFQAARDSFREEVIGERRSQFFAAYMARARERLRISIDAEGLKRVLG